MSDTTDVTSDVPSTPDAAATRAGGGPAVSKGCCSTSCRRWPRRSASRAPPRCARATSSPPSSRTRPMAGFPARAPRRPDAAPSRRPDETGAGTAQTQRTSPPAATRPRERQPSRGRGARGRSRRSRPRTQRATLTARPPEPPARRSPASDRASERDGEPRPGDRALTGARAAPTVRAERSATSAATAASAGRDDRGDRATGDRRPASDARPWRGNDREPSRDDRGDRGRPGSRDGGVDDRGEPRRPEPTAVTTGRREAGTRQRRRRRRRWPSGPAQPLPGPPARPQRADRGRR